MSTVRQMSRNHKIQNAKRVLLDSANSTILALHSRVENLSNAKLDLVVMHGRSIDPNDLLDWLETLPNTFNYTELELTDDVLE